MLIKLRAPAALASGKQGNQFVYFPWRGVQVGRDYVTPTNPQTPDQILVRNHLTTLAQSWASLSPSEVLSWQNYAAANPRINRLGESVVSTALGMYVAFNSILMAREDSPIDTAPTGSATAGASAVLSAAIAGGDFQIGISHTLTTTAGLTWMVRGTRVNSAYWTTKVKQLPLICGVNDGSFVGVETGVNAVSVAVSGMKLTPSAGEWWRIAVIAVNAAGQQSTAAVNTVQLVES